MKFLHYTSAVSQPCLLLLDANLALAEFFGWKWSLWPLLTWLAVQWSKAFFSELIWLIQWYETLLNSLIYTSAIPQPCLLLIAANLALPGLLGWKLRLWPVLIWLAVQWRKFVFSLTLHVCINDMKTSQLSTLYLRRATAILLLITANLAQAGFFGWKWNFWFVRAWLAVQQIKTLFVLTLYDSINTMKHFRNFFITPQPCHIHFCCPLLPIWP